MPAKKPKFCKDCQHFAPYRGLGLLEPTCTNDQCRSVNLVTAEKKVISCENARKGKCGEEGKFFKKG